MHIALCVETWPPLKETDPDVLQEMCPRNHHHQNIHQLIAHHALSLFALFSSAANHIHFVAQDHGLSRLPITDPVLPVELHCESGSC